MRPFFFAKGFLFASAMVFLGILSWMQPAQAATCAITTDTVIDQGYVDSNSCTAIEIQASVSTTWMGTVNLGGGTVTVKSGFTMTVGTSSVMTLGAADDFIIETGATATHNVQDPVGFQLNARNITIDGAIDATAKGCTGLTGAEDGYGPSTSTGQCIQSESGAGRGAGGTGGGGGGGSYAGLGGNGWVGVGGPYYYGSSLNPTFLGSGGGGGYYYGSAPGGNGGGRVAVVATGVLMVNGSIRADGGDAGVYFNSWNGGGGGSGGSVLIHAGQLDGTGSISADAGDGAVGAGNLTGGGGGGRTAVYFDSLGSFQLTRISASKGLTGGAASDGGVGTVYILDRTVDDGRGHLYLSGGFDFPDTGDYTRDAITIDSGTRFFCRYPMSTLAVSSTAWLTLSQVTWDCPVAIGDITLASQAGLSTTNTSITFSNATSVLVAAPTWTNATTTMAFTRSGTRVTWDISTDLSLNSFLYTGGDTGFLEAGGGMLTLARTIGITMVSSTIASNATGTLTNLSIDARSAWNASGKGCPSNNGASDGYGPNLTTGICTPSTSGAGVGGGGGGSGGGGAAHAGIGGSSGGGAPGNSTTYGSAASPIFPGSGGGGGYYIPSAPGGRGGGRIFLVITGTLTVDGVLRADGEDGTYGGSWSGGGGGSGGSIHIAANALAGGGAFSADGGDAAVGGNNQSGGGGGGRIALTYYSLSFTGTSSTAAGAAGGAVGSGYGGAGSIYIMSFYPPSQPTLTAPVSGIYNASRNPSLVATAYDNSPGNLTHRSTDWKVTTDALGSSTVWSSLLDTDDLTSIAVTTAKGSFGGALSGQTMLAASTTYYAFVRYRNDLGPSDWSTAVSFTTPFMGASSTQAYVFDDADPGSLFTYTTTTVEVNASGNSYARLKVDEGGRYGGTALNGWTKYKDITVSNNDAVTYTNVQIPITVSYDADMQSDFDDIRFTNLAEASYSFYLARSTSSDEAYYYVKLPRLDASTATTVRMYYGNPAATSASDMATTMRNSYATDVNLVGEWLMSNGSGTTITDSSGNGNNATFAFDGSGGWGSDSFGFTGGSLTLDGSADYAETPVSITGTFTDDFTLEGWANIANAGDCWGWFFGETGGGTFLFGKQCGSASLHFNMDGLGSAGAISSYSTGAWHHFVFVHDKGTSNGTKIYVDGELVNTVDASSWSPTTNGNLYFGRRTGGEYFNGGLDDMRVYTRALSQAEVQAHYQHRVYVTTNPSVSTGSEMSAALFSNISLTATDASLQPEYVFLYRFEETSMPGSTGEVRYQLSNNNGSTWKYWNGSAWATATTTVDQANDLATINAHLPRFASDVGTGSLETRMVFVSDGTQPTGLDALRIFYAPANLPPSSPSSLAPTALINGSATGTDTPIFSFVLADPDGGDTLRYQIQVDNNSDFSSPVVDYTSSLASQGTRTFQVGQALGGGTYTLGASGQTLADGSYYWRVRAIDPGGEASSYVVANSGSIAFQVDTAARSIQFSTPSASGLESVSDGTARLVLDTPHFENVSVTYSVAGTAASGTDYGSLASGTATISAGETSTTIPLTIIDDTAHEPNETIVLTLSSPVNAALGVNTAFTYTIIDNDSDGGGAATAVPGGTSVSAPPSFIGTVTPLPTPLPTPVVPPTIIVRGEEPAAPPVTTPSAEVVTILSPGDVVSLIEASHGSRDYGAEARYGRAVGEDARSFRVSLSDEQRLRLANFVTYGISERTRALGAGERRALIRDALETMGTADINPADLERMTRGLIPQYRNIARERAQLPRVRQTFRSIYGHDPNFQNREENLAWNTLMYRMRFPRDLEAEREGIQAFRQTFHRSPADPFQWATVRVMGYVQS